MSIALVKPLRQWIKNASLRWVLTVPFVFLTLGAVVLVGWLSYQSGQKAVGTLAQQLVAGTNDRVIQEIRTYLQTPILINRLNVDAVNQGQLNLQNVSVLEAGLLNRLQQFDQVTAVLFASPQGTFRAVERSPALHLAAADPDRPDSIAIYPLDRQGKRGQSVDTLKGLDVRRDRALYQRAAATGQPGWSPISQDSSAKALTLDASQPVYDRATKQLLGVFGVHLRLEYLSKFLHRLEISRKGQIIITDQSGMLIALSTGEKPYKITANTKLNRQFKQLKIDESENDLTRSLGKSLQNRNLASLNQPESLEFRYNGELQSVQITPFHDQYGLNWRIFTVIPASQFMRAIHDNLHTTAVLCLLTLGAAIALGVFAADQFTAHFTQFHQVSRELAAGNLDRRLLPNTPIYELNRLTQTFNQMADRLQQSFDRLESDLAESEEKFTLIFHSSPDPITLVTMPEGRCVEANESFLNLLEYSREELIEQRFLDLGVWSNLDDRDRFLQTLQQQGRVSNLEVQLATRTEQSKTVLLSAELIEINDELYALGIIRDISDRARIEAEHKQAEAALQESETRFRQLAETVREGFFVFETESAYYSYVNPAYHAIRGATNQTSYGDMSHWLNNIHPDDRARIEAGLEQERQGKPFHEEYRFIRQDGEIRWLRSQAFPLRNEAGAIVRVVGTVEDISDRKAAELALQQNEARYRAIVEDQTELIIRFLPDTTVLFVNDAYCRYFGLEREAIIGKSYSPIIYEADRDRVTQLIHSLSVTNPTLSIENRVVINGEIRWTQWIDRLLFDEQGNIIEFQSVGRDITELKQAEAKIQQLNQQLAHRVDELQALFNVLPIGVAISEDPDCLIARTNPCLSEILRVPLNENASQSAPSSERPAYRVYRNGQLLSIADLPMQYAAIHNVEVRDEVADIVHPDGTVISLLSYASPLRDDRGKVRGVIGGFVDISERKQTEEALRRSEALFRSAFDDAPIGVSLISPTGQFLKANPCYCNIVGYTEAELLKLTFQEITHPDDQEADLEGLRQMLAGEIDAFHLKKRFITKQGTIVPILINAAPIRDHNGQVAYVVAHIQDIRDRLEVERMKDEFISVVSHELRTPLTSIRGALGILGSGVFRDRPEKAEHMLNIAINNSDRLVRLVDDILSLERLSSGKVQLVMEHCQVADLMQQAVDSVQTLADQSGVILCLTSVAATLWADPDTIIQMLTNLLSNAIKFSPAGSTVWLKAELEHGEWAIENRKAESILASLPSKACILFRVIDQGRGIPSNKLEVIFDQFQQVDVSDSRQKGGTGLGLAICKTIVQRHGGQIWVESRLGEGSTFYVALPLQGANEDD